MGYSVAVIADSTSRWAEALREMSGRLEEMPGEEGYPAYLPTRLAQFYERSGNVICLGKDGRKGALSVLGAVSPPGGDLADPVVQGTLKVVQVFWGLDDKLAYRRHFPAISWLNSYSLYVQGLKPFMEKEIAPDWPELRQEGMKLLQQESELEEIARLVGIDTLSTHDRLVLETARSIREDFLHQNAFHEIDTYTSLKKQYRMLKIIMEFHRMCLREIDEGVEFAQLMKLPVREEMARAKYIPEKEIKSFDVMEKRMKEEIVNLSKLAEKQQPEAGKNA
jgi:V/A-type H+-transporting ATPase subunit A